MEKRIAMLLNGEVNNDYRVIKMIRTLSKNVGVDLYYINGVVESDQLHFNASVRLKSIPHGVNFKTKVLQHSYFCFEFNFFINEVIRSKEQYQLVWANDLPTLYPAWRLSVHFDCPLVYDSHEIYIETLNQFFPRNAKGIKQIIYKLILFLMRLHGREMERNMLKKVDFFITVNESILEYFRKNYDVKNGNVIMNLPNFSNQPENTIDYRKIYNWDKSDTILIYQGVLNEGRGLRTLLESLERMSNKFKLIIVGDGPLRIDLEKICEEKKIKNRVKFEGKVCLNDLKRYTSGADIGINLLEDFNLSKKMASPNKLFEYIHAEIPILATNTIENAKVLFKYQVGELVENNIISIIKGINEINENFEIKERNNVFDLAKKEYSWENQEENIKNLLNKKIT
jgi:glycosyltransferase involved in cell wall biosynthesis